MPGCGFSVLTAPRVCLYTLEYQVVGATASLPALVPAADSWLGGAGLPAALLSSGLNVFHLQGQWQEGALPLAGFGVFALFAAAALVMGFLSAARKRTQGEVRESELRHRLLFESSPYPAWVFDMGTLSFLTVNEAALHFYGYSREEFLRMTIKDIRPPEDVPKLLSRLSENRGRLSLDEVWRHRKKDGTVVYVEVTSRELSYRGRRAVMVLAHDISERVRAEAALRRAEEKYRGIFENAVEGIFQSTPDGRFISVNPAMARMHGFDSPEQMIAERTDIERQHYVDPRRRAELLRTMEERGFVLNFVAETYRRDGSTIWTSSNTRVVRYAEGAARYYEGFVQEITDRVRADEWEQKQKRLMALRADVVAALSEGGLPLRDVLQQSAEAIARHLDAALARIWTLNQGEDVLELQASAGMYTHLDGPHSRIPVGRFKVGLIAKERAPHLTNDLQGDERISDKEWARREGLVAFAGYPLLVEGRLVGVMAMFTRCPLSGDTLDALSVIADTVAQGVERVRAELALRENESRFRRLIEGVHVGIVLSGPEGECFLANEGAHKLLGLTADQLAGRTPADPAWNIIRSDGTPFPGEESPLMRSIATRKPVRNVLMGVYRQATQDRVWLLVDAEPHPAADGSVSHVVTTLTDVTEWKRAEDSLRQSEERNRAMLEAVPDIVLLMSKEGVYLDCHVKDLGDLPFPISHFLGKNVRDVLPPEVAEDFITYFDRTILLGETHAYEFTIRGRVYETRIVRCEDDKILIIARDVTAHKKAEAQRTMLLRRLVNAEAEERARLAREVHDEFAAYLAALKWGLESLGRAEAAPAESNLSYLLGLTTRLQQKVRDFAFELSPAELDDKGGLPAALDQYVRRWAELAGGRLEAEFCAEGLDAGPARLPREVELALYRVAQEALTNVLKHARARHVAVTLSFDAAEPGRGVVSLTVKDDGVGFVQAHEEVAERGLGLKGIGERVALVGGALEVRSGNEGTRLTVSVPFSTPHREERGDERSANTARR